MKTIYLAPHLDDAALSCGGLVWMQTQAGQRVEIWTMCAGDPPEGRLSDYAQVHHDRWGVGREAAAVRREEDARSCEILGAVLRHLGIPDAIYRRDPKTGAAWYTTDEALFGRLQGGEEALVEWLGAELAAGVEPDDRLIAPLTLGNHVDHQLTRAAAEGVGLPLAYYADYPYAAEHGGGIPALLPEGYMVRVHPVSEGAMAAWEEGAAAHRSQISTFWADESRMRAALRMYRELNGGVRLWGG